ncbi:MAG: amidohydrolase family protein [bacterium]|nr:amidohydrolase family protein [bacterium]
MTWLHIQNADLCTPEPHGATDLLCWNDRIVAVGSNLTPPPFASVETLNANGRTLLPGLIDAHIHVMGASSGPAGRTPDLPLSRITRTGITTVVSPLGTDSLSRSVPGLLMRAAALSEEGISAYIYTGGWKNPIPTLTGDPQADVTFLDRVLGIKVALSEPSAPPFSAHDLAHLAHAAIIGGRLAGKHTVLHAHIGDHPDGLKSLRTTIEQTGLPPDRFVATHVNRNPELFQQTLHFARSGGSIDITAQIRKDQGYPNALEPTDAILTALEAGIAPERITLSSDSGGSYPRPNGTGLYLSGPDNIFKTLSDLTTRGLTWPQAIAFSTKHPADLLGLPKKGRIAEGADADLLLLSETNTIDCVWSRGRLMVENGNPIAKSEFE